MARSVSAPSSVTKTSPCWNGLIVPGSTFRYGSNFWSWTRRPRAFSRRPSEAATIPFPSADTTPPVTKTYFGARALTGFQCSSTGGRRSQGGRGLDEVVQTAECLLPEHTSRAPEESAFDREHRLGPVRSLRRELELRLEPFAQELERESPQGNDLVHDEHGRRIRPLEVARALHLPARSFGEPAPVRLDAGDAGPPVRQVVRLGDEAPDVLDRGEEGELSCGPQRGTPARRASVRSRPSARPRRGGRCACASGRPGSSRRGSAGRRRPRSAADA